MCICVCVCVCVCVHVCSGVDLWVHRLYQYHSLGNTPMGDELKWLLKEGGGCIFENPKIG